jgi:ATP-dependent Clp protease adaptor protein ClpS
MGTNQMIAVDSSVEEKDKIVIEEPGFYKVILLNDDVTPMEFVIEVCQKIFKHDHVTATNLTMTIHHEGAAVVGVYLYEIAEQKGIETTVQARNHGFPLQVKIERE